MEFSVENAGKPRFWLELPVEAAKMALRAVLSGPVGEPQRTYIGGLSNEQIDERLDEI